MPLLGAALEVAAGAVAYVGACFVVARPVSYDFLGPLRQSYRRRGAEPGVS